jgi:lipopolysaccharide exporter
MSQSSSLGQRIAAGATWMVLQRMAMRIIGLASTIVLARLLVPADFGLVALAASVMTVLDLVLDFGFDLALIQDQRSERRRYDAAWTLSVVRGVLLMLLLAALAYPMAQLYDDPRLVEVMLWLAAACFVAGLQNIGIVDFRRELQFDQEFRLLVISKMVSFVVTLSIAWFWRDYHALVAGILMGKITALVLSYTMHPYRPRVSFAGTLEFVSFSKWLFLNNVVSAVRIRLDSFVIGKVSSASSLGVYTVAFEISSLTTTELIWPIARVLFPGFAKMTSDRGRLARNFIESVAVLVFLGAPVSVGIAVTANQIVGIFLGDQWLAAVPLIQVLTLYGLFNLPLSNCSALYLALGRPDLIFWRNLPGVIALVPLLIAGVVMYGPVGAAWALAASAAITLSISLWMLKRDLGIGLWPMFLGCWRPLVAAGVMAAVVLAIEARWTVPHDVIHLLPQLLVLASSGAVVYAATVLVLWLLSGRPQGAETRAIEIMHSVLGLMRRRPTLA